GPALRRAPPLNSPYCKRGRFHNNLNITHSGVLLILHWPNFVFEMQRRFLPLQSHPPKPFRGKGKLSPSARCTRTEIIQQYLAVLLPSGDKLKNPSLVVAFGDSVRTGPTERMFMECQSK